MALETQGRWTSILAKGSKSNRKLWCESFTKYTPKRIRRRSIAVFDIETEDATLLGKPGGIAFTSDYDYPNVVTFNNQHESCMIKLLKHYLVKRYRGFVAYAHKGMSFDVSHILANKEVQKWLLREGFFVYVDRSFAIIRKDKHSWYLGDSLRIIPEKLEKVLKSYAPHRKKAALPESPFDWRVQGWVDRIMGDTLGLYEALKKTEEIIFNTFQTPMSMTMPSTALKAARAMLPIESTKRPCRTALDWLRSGGYSGGRIEIFYQGPIEGNIYCFDINSAYAWAMKGEFPLGSGIYRTIEPKSGFYISRCLVQVSKQETLPPVLSRLFNHAFCTGEFQAMLTKDEVEWARECKAKVEIIECWHWQETFPVFRGFIEKCETLRKEDYSGPLGKTVKLMQNGLYGILGMNPFRTVHLLSIDRPNSDWLHAFDLTTGTYVPNAYETIDYRESPSQMPHWAAIITARVRVQLSRYLKEIKQAGMKPLYAHTDSIWAVSPLKGLPEKVQALIGEEYGKLKLERQGDYAVIVAPGEGAIRTKELDEDGKPKWHIASKGWAATPEIFENGVKTKLEQVQVYRAGTALKRGSPGRVVEKVVMNYNAMTNREPPIKTPGYTKPFKAGKYNYEKYWSYAQWFVGKLLIMIPARDKYRIAIDPYQQLLKWYQVPEKRKAWIRKLRSAAYARMEREFNEGYEKYLTGGLEFATLRWKVLTSLGKEETAP